VAEIRTATERDVPAILALIEGLAEYERLAEEVVATEPALRESLFGRTPRAEVVMAWEGESAAGFAVWFHTYSTFLARPGLYLEDLFVRPAFRGRGIGRQLLRHLASVAVARGCGRMEWSVLDWNQPAIGFYERLGARRMEQWHLYRLTGDRLAALAAEGAFT
jgi:GNAT superfamily N-acetyltransferase